MKSQTRQYSLLDKVCIELDKGLRTVFAQSRQHERARPDSNLDNFQILSSKETKFAGRLMRINHCGEVCAQALYQGQALTAHNASTKEKMHQAAEEENDHLAWCEARLEELNTNTSLLNPFFYTGSLVMGAVAGAIGDKWSLGFVQETENQVEAHLGNHLQRLPENDGKSRVILRQMQEDEIKHANMAQEAGAADLPQPIKTAMRFMSQLMTKTTFYL